MRRKKDINAYNEKVATEIADRDNSINDVVKEITPIHASLENWKREVPEFFIRPRKMNTQSLGAREGNFPSASEDLHVAEIQLDLSGVGNKIGGEGMAHFPEEPEFQIPLQTDMVREQALDHVMAVFAAAADQTPSSMQKPADKDVVRVADGW